MKFPGFLIITAFVPLVLLCSGCEKDPGPIKASFQLSEKVVDPGEYITATSNSENAETYFWDFGNNVTSKNAMDSVAYNAPGKYQLELKAYNADKEFNREKQVINVCPCYFNRVELTKFNFKDENGLPWNADGKDPQINFTFKSPSSLGFLFQNEKVTQRRIPLSYNISTSSSGYPVTDEDWTFSLKVNGKTPSDPQRIVKEWKFNLLQEFKQNIDPEGKFITLTGDYLEIRLFVNNNN